LSLARSARKLRRIILAVNGAVSLLTTSPGRRSGSYRTVARQPVPARASQPPTSPGSRQASSGTVAGQPVPAGSARQAVWITVGPATERWAIRLPGSYSVTSSQELAPPHGLHDHPSAAPHSHGGGRIQPLGL